MRNKDQDKKVRKYCWTFYFIIFLNQAKFQTTKTPTPFIYATFICCLWPNILSQADSGSWIYFSSDPIVLFLQGLYLCQRNICLLMGLLLGLSFSCGLLWFCLIPFLYNCRNGGKYLSVYLGWFYYEFCCIQDAKMKGNI